MSTVSRDQAETALDHVLTVLTTEKNIADQTGGNPRTDAQFNAVNAAAALLARTPDHS
ncbi:hypothetical protein ACFVIY_17805 [Streptomyces sp. NPDC127166]|uniref:hypothetical protein n=1 Tax=Streptomyces sp. NPDC127166 TaxID=3345380 RepID=UPI00362C6368